MMSTMTVIDGTTREYDVKAAEVMIRPLNKRRNDGKVTDVVCEGENDWRDNWQCLAQNRPREV
jgi:hypothetical protein